MKKRSALIACVLGILVLSGLIGCAGGQRGTLNRVENPTEEALRQNWNDYTVYYRRGYALIFKTKDDSKIELNRSWTAVTSDGMMKSAGIGDFTFVQEIIGQNNKKFGYMVHRRLDSVYVGIVDENTIKISYYVKVTWGSH